MNSLVNYGSDDDYDDSSEEKQTDWRGTTSRDKPASSSKETDVNYEEVQMDLSEESNDSKSESKEASRRSRERESKDRRDDHKSRHERERRGSRDKDSRSRNDHNHRRDRERKSRRSPSRERRRSRSPRRSDRESRHSRSRSRSRDRSRKYSKRYDRGGKSQSDRIDSQKSVDEDKRTNTSESDRFFMPGITGRFRDQIERRKQLWQKKDADPKDNKNNGQSKKVWETTTFAQDTDGKVANKFKRLMGIRGNTEGAGQGTEVLKKQEEMFSSMEQQYEVARTATHTMRGVGLGFGSYQR
ncbi:hypothetical protein MTP99_006287 [Tenebrio molitor]|jgi:hypothetical protein|nr:hypothetical protein MTP99_006287 [Tenebrio molitor]